MEAQLDVRQLKHLHAIITTGSFSSAAAALGISQSALTQSVANLEREVGVSLLERSQAGARATAAGILLHNRSELILMEIERATLELKEVGGATPEIRIGIDRTLSHRFISAVLSPFMASRRHMILMVREQWNDELKHALARGELDLIISSLPGFVDDYNLTTERLFDKSTRAVVRRDHRLVGKASPTMEDLSEALWGLRAPGPFDASPELAAFAAAGISMPQKIMYTDSTALLVSQVLEAEMIGFLSTDLVQGHLQNQAMVVLNVDGLYVREPVYLAHHARSRLKPSVVQLKSEIIAAARKTAHLA
jgi:DNA-binding transcriptional LysR family regulator